ncbi:MAG: hypothetical protein QM484_12660 [Woeseiaceae bacterium]
MTLPKTLFAYDTPEFKTVLKNEIQNIGASQLPLQQCLSFSSAVGDSDFSIVVLKTSVDDKKIHIKTGVFYTGIIAGCSCSDDPTPTDEQNEYCEMLFSINRDTAETHVSLLEFSYT